MADPRLRRVPVPWRRQHGRGGPQVSRLREAGPGLTSPGARRWSLRLVAGLAVISTAVAGLTTPCAGQTRRRTGPASVPAAARHAGANADFAPVGFPSVGRNDDG